MSVAASGKGIHRPLKSKREEAAGHQYRAKVSFLLSFISVMTHAIAVNLNTNMSENTFNVFFWMPAGLMPQMSSSSGGC